MINILSTDFHKHYYSLFDTLREIDPIFHYQFPNGKNAWIVSRYNDCRCFLQKHQLFFQDDRLITYAMIQGAFWTRFLDQKGIEHRIRYWTKKALSPKYMIRIMNHFRSHINNVLAKLVTGHEIDLMDLLKDDLPISLMEDLLMIHDNNYFRSWSLDIVRGTVILGKNSGGNSFQEYLEKIVEQRAKEPMDDLLTQFIREGEDSESIEIFITNLLLLLTSSTQIMISIVACSVVALHEFPEQKMIFCKNPECVDVAIEEFLRYYSPIPLLGDRWVKKDLVFQGKKMKKGDLILLALGSANRDEEVFSMANILNITRTPNPHIAFGNGPTSGEWLAKQLAKEVLLQLYQHFPRLRLGVSKENIIYRPKSYLYLYSVLPVVL